MRVRLHQPPRRLQAPQHQLQPRVAGILRERLIEMIDSLIGRIGSFIGWRAAAEMAVDAAIQRDQQRRFNPIASIDSRTFRIVSTS